MWLSGERTAEPVSHKSECDVISWDLVCAGVTFPSHLCPFFTQGNEARCEGSSQLCDLTLSVTINVNQTFLEGSRPTYVSASVIRPTE
jgi:hypothetical protein